MDRTGLGAALMNHSLPSPQQLLFAPGDPLTHSQGSQYPGDMTSLSLGKEFHPRVASELVPRGYTQASQDETAKSKVME